MRPDSPRWVEVTPSEHSHERAGLTTVRDLLPDAEPYRAWSNFTFTTADGRLYEVDLLVIGRAGLRLVELKHWSGRITGTRRRGGTTPIRWTTRRLLADAKAKRLASLLKEHSRRVRVPFVTASVLLHAPHTEVALDDRGRSGVYGVDGQGPRGLAGVVAQLLKACGIRRSLKHRQVGTLLVDEELLAEGRAGKTTSPATPSSRESSAEFVST